MDRIIAEHFEGANSLEGFSVEVRANYPSCARDPVPIEIRNAQGRNVHSRFLSAELAWSILHELASRGAKIRGVSGGPIAEFSTP